MSETFSNPANTSGSQVPLSYESFEVTTADIEKASKDTIATAAFDDIDRLRQAMARTNSPAEQKYIRQHLIEARSTMNALDNWNEGGQKTFREFVENSVSDREAPQWSTEAYTWMGRSDHLISDVIRAKAQEAVAPEVALTKQQLEVSSQTNPITEMQQQAQKQRAVDEARKNIEKSRGVEVFDEIVKFGKNKTHLHTGLERGFGQIGDATVKNNQITFIPESIRQEVRQKPDWREHLNEAVMFSVLTEPDTQVITKERQIKGRFGISHTETYTETVGVPESDHPVMLRNEQTAQDEPAVRFNYQFKYSPVISSQRGQVPDYQEFAGNRNGQSITVGLDLPKSLADKLQTQIESNPSSVRELIEKLFIEDSDGSMTSQKWHEGGDRKHPVRPPYEDLPNGWVLGIITGTLSTKGGYQNSGRLLNHEIRQVPTTN